MDVMEIGRGDPLIEGSVFGTVSWLAVAGAHQGDSMDHPIFTTLVKVNEVYLLIPG